jgi:uncharacterized protein (DUF433 family)
MTESKLHRKPSCGQVARRIICFGDEAHHNERIQTPRTHHCNPQIFGGKPIIRGRRLAVEHVLGMLAAGDTADVLCESYPWMDPQDIQACLVYAQR